MKKTTELFPQIQIESDVKRLVKISNVNFDEDFIAQLVSNYFRNSRIRNCPTISHALEISSKRTPQQKERNLGIMSIITIKPLQIILAIFHSTN